MWWRNRGSALRGARLALVLGAAGLLAGCFQPLYGSNPSVGGESVKDKLAEVQIGSDRDAPGHAAGPACRRHA